MKAVGNLSGLLAGSKPDRRQGYPQNRVYWRSGMQVKTQPEATASQCQGNGFMPENQHHNPYVGPQAYGQQAGAANGLRDMNGNILAHLFSKMGFQNQPNGSKPFPVKGGMPMHPGPNVDVSGMQHYPHGQYMIVPNGSMFGGVPPAPQFGQFPLRAPDQGSSLHCIPPTFYPGFPTNPPFSPDCISGYPWPYFPNGDFPNHGNMSLDPRTSVDEINAGSPHMDLSGPQEYYPGAAPADRPPAPGYMYNTPAPQPFLPYQMMKSGSGYVLQDLDALVKQDPPIPRAVPAMWTNPSDLTLAKCLGNREGITNVYIRGFLPETTDEMLHNYASRFGKIDRCKAIIDLETGSCKGFGFVQFFSFDACENCIRGFFHLGYQASFAQKSRNSRLKDLEDKSSTNVYCTNVPIDWAESDLRRHFEPFQVVSEKISRDEKTGVSKEVGFARFETREVAEQVVQQFHNVAGKDGVKLLLRFADTKAQKQLKYQSNERRAYRAGEYNYSVELVNSATPSPSLHRLQQAASHFSPASQGSFPSPLGGVGQVWTPATSISPP
ncbi:Meiotic RNA-binding protein 1 [Arthroderma uncinatum]|uniref:Meiotic RNA-binding protein 1 n=1 Tax=Arthroderma uncinatum TaxID=74035 RepID=UPI00144A7C00|nr:Meiotic RNA-binding protein 1 [Arthroderma uncinatum]KAF3482174.1 Meiotic RNA-binding protein 1 [Arthroderma uncinatum]